jgi:hypothetical protein
MRTGLLLMERDLIIQILTHKFVVVFRRPSIRNLWALGRGGGVVNQGVTFAGVDIQRNINAFIILAENIRVGIAIADNTIYTSIHIKNILNILPNIKAFYIL